jgi:hypothetical protein
MSYNQTNKIHNPFEGEELEKGIPTGSKQAIKQLTNAIGILNESSKQLYKVGKEMRKATNLVEGAAGHMNNSALVHEIGPKPDRKKRREAQRIMREIKNSAKDLLKLDESIIMFDARDYAIGLASLAAKIDMLEKGR